MLYSSVFGGFRVREYIYAHVASHLTRLQQYLVIIIDVHVYTLFYTLLQLYLLLFLMICYNLVYSFFHDIYVITLSSHFFDELL